MTSIARNIIGIVVIMILYGGTAWGQIIEDSITIVEELPDEIEETSGLIFHNGKLWTHNDSGGEPILYSIDTATGEVLERKTIVGVTNEDWEDIAKDENYLYIGNVGAMSSNLQILRINIGDLDNPELDAIQPTVISFTYGNDDYPEENFDATNTRFDCETLIAKDDTIFLFSKNWVDHKTYLYAIPNNTEVTHTVTPIDTLELTYLVCGADYDRSTNTIALVGYTYNTSGSIPESKPYLTIMRNFEGNKFFEGDIESIEMPATPTDNNMIMFNQTEGIAFRDSVRLWVSNEKFTQSIITIKPKLRQYKISAPSVINNCEEPDNDASKISIYPNPATESLQIEINGAEYTYSIGTLSGALAIESNKQNEGKTEIDISALAKGTYTIAISTNETKRTFKFIKL